MTPRAEARGVRRVFASGAGVEEVDLTVTQGEIHALVGLNGAGKSTLMRLLTQMLRPDRGTVLVEGVDIRRARPVVWSRVGHLVECPLAYRELTARANLEVSARLHGLPRARVGRAVDAVLDELDLTRYADRRTATLSLGNRQRLGLAAALLHDPLLVILDEPTNALDPAGVIRLRESLRRRAAGGAGVLVSSHHLDEVSRIADRISIMNRGRIVGGLAPGTAEIEHAFFTAVHDDDLLRAEEYAC